MFDNKKYFWFKCSEDFFNERAVKKLHKIEGGDSIVYFYMRLMLMSVADEGVVEYLGVDDSLEEELAIALDESPDFVFNALSVLKKIGLVEYTGEDSLFIPAAVENTGESKTSTQRVREFREKRKAAAAKNATAYKPLNLNETPLKHDETACETQVKQSETPDETLMKQCETENETAEKDIDKEKDTELNKSESETEREKEGSATPDKPASFENERPVTLTYEEAAECENIWPENETCPYPEDYTPYTEPDYASTPFYDNNKASPSVSPSASQIINNRELNSSSQPASPSEIENNATASEKINEFPECSIFLKDGTEHFFTREDIAAYKEKYPMVSIKNELVKVHNWTRDNVDKRRDYCGMMGVIDRWLTEKQSRNIKKKMNKNEQNASHIQQGDSAVLNSYEISEETKTRLNEVPTCTKRKIAG